jgi:endoglucanase
VYHKLSTRDFCGMIMPETETEPQLFAPWSSAATADFVAMMAAAARHFRDADSDFAARCLSAARLSHGFLQAHPENHRADLRAFKTGAYATQDGDDRLWAAAELWETTGDTAVLEDLEVRIREQRSLIDVDFDWGNVKNLGLITYLNSTRPGRDAALVNEISESLLATADQIAETAADHLHARPMGRRYYWGCNGSVARQTLVLYAAHRVSPKPAYRSTALDAVNHLFGRNPYGRSYVTGMGHRPPLHPHDRRSAADEVIAPWPGYLVGGPHRDALSWEDEEENYRCNEIAINWNGALIYALAAFLEGTAWNAPLR